MHGAYFPLTTEQADGFGGTGRQNYQINYKLVETIQNVQTSYWLKSGCVLSS